MNSLLEWLNPFELTVTTGILSILVALVLFVLANLLAAFLIACIPADYFRTPAASWIAQRHPAVVWARRIGKNLAGAVLVLLGTVLSLPGVPGPGLIVILMGVMLIDFPGKRRLERKMIARPRVLHLVNSLRARMGAQPLVLDGSPSSGHLQPQPADPLATHNSDRPLAPPNKRL
jgi:hypothetical protein